MELKKISVPQTLDECTEKPALVLQLSSWAESLTVWDFLIFCVIVIIGLIVSLSAAYVEDTFEWGVFFVSCFTWAVYSAAELGTCIIIETLLRALTSIVYSSHVAAVAELFQAALLQKEIGEQSENKQ